MYGCGVSVDGEDLSAGHDRDAPARRDQRAPRPLTLTPYPSPGIIHLPRVIRFRSRPMKKLLTLCRHRPVFAMIRFR